MRRPDEHVLRDERARGPLPIAEAVSFVLDATYTHDRVTREGELISADELARVTAVNLEPEFCRVVTTSEAIEELAE